MTTTTVEKAINAKPWDVLALLRGATQIRRVVKPQPHEDYVAPIKVGIGHPEITDRRGELAPGDPVFAAWWEDHHAPCPHPTGSRVWVRETWATLAEDDKWSVHELGPGAVKVWYRADGPDDSCVGRPRASTTMPRWAARLVYDVRNVRVERVQEIGKDGRKAVDVLACGIEQYQIDNLRKWFHQDDSPALAYSHQWDRDNPAHPWERNPWAWVYEIERVQP